MIKRPEPSTPCHRPEKERPELWLAWLCTCVVSSKLEPPSQLQVPSTPGYGTQQESAELHGISSKGSSPTSARQGTRGPQRKPQPTQSSFCTDRYLVPRPPAQSVLSREGKASVLVVGTSFQNGAVKDPWVTTLRFDHMGISSWGIGSGCWWSPTMDLDLGAINRADSRTEGQGQTGIVPAHNARALAAGESEGGQVYAIIPGPAQPALHAPLRMCEAEVCTEY